MKALLFLFLIPFSHKILAQCPSGSIGILNANGGCLSGCDLSAYGGPVCDGATGNTSGNPTVFTDITVPLGCTFTLVGVMQNRPGCSASGADGGDGMKVDIAGGGKAFQSGSSNASLNDSYTLTGPGTIRVSCRANRRDEIVTYSVSSSGASCENCYTTLAVELVDFTATKSNENVELFWQTSREYNNDYFSIQRSADGYQFEDIYQLKGVGESNELHNYSVSDVNPLNGISYYRLKQTDIDGTSSISEIRSVVFNQKDELLIFPNPVNGELNLQFAEEAEDKNIQFYNELGQQVFINEMSVENKFIRQYDTESLPNGVYYFTVKTKSAIHSGKFVKV